MSGLPDYNRIADSVTLGEGVQLACYINAYGCTIGDECKVGAFVEIQKGAVIGRRCKISSHTFICEGVTLEDNVFIGHGVMFTNDKVPRATGADGSLQTEADWSVVPTTIATGASIGSGSTLLCGIRVGENAVVGAGSVVTRDIPAGEVWCGNPAQFLKQVESP